MLGPSHVRRRLRRHGGRRIATAVVGYLRLSRGSTHKRGPARRRWPFSPSFSTRRPRAMLDSKRPAPAGCTAALPPSTWRASASVRHPRFALRRRTGLAGPGLLRAAPPGPSDADLVSRVDQQVTAEMRKNYEFQILPKAGRLDFGNASLSCRRGSRSSTEAHDHRAARHHHLKVPVRSPRICVRRTGSTGFTTKSSKPASNDRSRSSVCPYPVSATRRVVRSVSRRARRATS